MPKKRQAKKNSTLHFERVPVEVVLEVAKDIALPKGEEAGADGVVGEAAAKASSRTARRSSRA